MHLVYSCSNNKACTICWHFWQINCWLASVYFSVARESEPTERVERMEKRRAEKFILFDRLHCSKWYRGFLSDLCVTLFVMICVLCANAWRLHQQISLSYTRKSERAIQTNNGLNSECIWDIGMNTVLRNKICDWLKYWNYREKKTHRVKAFICWRYFDIVWLRVTVQQQQKNEWRTQSENSWNEIKSHNNNKNVREKKTEIMFISPVSSWVDLKLSVPNCEQESKITTEPSIYEEGKISDEKNRAHKIKEFK